MAAVLQEQPVIQQTDWMNSWSDSEMMVLILNSSSFKFCIMIQSLYLNSLVMCLQYDNVSQTTNP